MSGGGQQRLPLTFLLFLTAQPWLLPPPSFIVPSDVTRQRVLRRGLVHRSKGPFLRGELLLSQTQMLALTSVCSASPRCSSFILSPTTFELPILCINSSINVPSISLFLSPFFLFSDWTLITTCRDNHLYFYKGKTDPKRKKIAKLVPQFNP